MKSRVAPENRHKRENERLKSELEEARETLRAIKSGEVDALVVQGEGGEQIFTLKSAEKPYRMLVETMNEGAATLDAEGIIFYCNQRFSEMAGRQLENLMGSSVHGLFSSRDRKAFSELFEEAKKGGGKRVLQMKGGEGGLIPVLFSMSAVEVEGTPGVCLVATDLTQQAILEKSRTELERLSIERELREQFVSTLSHDLRNPLSAIKTSAQLIVRSRDQVERHLVHGARILKNVERADKMIQDLLDANRIRAGERLPLEIAECDLRQTTEETLEDLAVTHGNRFVLRADGPVVGFWSCVQLRRVIENLATNAIKYGATDAPVSVSLKKERDRASLTVHNQGTPLTKEEQATLFKPFARSRKAQAGRQVGWGLGLTLVRGVAEAHGGQVLVESADGKGTSFTVILPRDSRPFQGQGAAT